MIVASTLRPSISQSALMARCSCVRCCIETPHEPPFLLSCHTRGGYGPEGERTQAMIQKSIISRTGLQARALGIIKSTESKSYLPLHVVAFHLNASLAWNSHNAACNPALTRKYPRCSFTNTRLARSR
ncbi:hypothetical protein PVAG01_02452 [Phlyctema vagabunda]|uniref:Uncharacterized protein n=1 Tax=Phlyctema vagabunda TaxID=108571 RepID=A0ABR4PRX9_9HELO